MNKEIKEILDRLDYNEWEVDLYKVPITWCELYDIRDYITNLQQENEYLKKQNDEKTKIGIADHKYASQMEDKVIELQQDNEKIGKLWREEEAHCILLQQENERLKETIKHYEDTTTFGDYVKEVNLLIDYKSRCEKASENLQYGINTYHNGGSRTALFECICDSKNILQNGSDSQ